MSNNKTVGMFSIPMDTIQDKLDAVRALMCNAGMVVLMAEQTQDGNINYMAVSDIFEELEEGERVPWYRLESNTDGRVEAERVIPEVQLATDVPEEALVVEEVSPPEMPKGEAGAE